MCRRTPQAPSSPLEGCAANRSSCIHYLIRSVVRQDMPAIVSQTRHDNREEANAAQANDARRTEPPPVAEEVGSHWAPGAWSLRLCPIGCEKLIMAHNVAPPESSAVAFAEMAEALNKDSSGGDTVEKAKQLLEPKGMTVNTADVEAFRKVAQEKVWPQYQKDMLTSGTDCRDQGVRSRRLPRSSRHARPPYRNAGVKPPLIPPRPRRFACRS
jgi:hypothetical protein